VPLTTADISACGKDRTSGIEVVRGGQMGTDTNPDWDGATVKRWMASALLATELP